MSINNVNSNRAVEGIDPVVEALPAEFVPVEGVSNGGGKGKGVIVGAGTGALNTAVLSPVDRLNNRRVTEGRHIPLNQVFSRGAFRGVGVNLAGNMVNYTALFGVQPLVSAVAAEVLASSTMAKMATGAMSGTAQALVSRPFSNISLKAQTSEGLKYREMLRQIPEGQIVRTLYRGVEATIMRNGSHAMVYFPAYDCIMQVLTSGSFDKQHQPNNALKLGMGFTAGAMAGGLGTIVSLPMHNASVIQATSATKISSIQAMKVLAGRGVTAPWQTLALTSTRMATASAMAGVVTEGINIVYDRYTTRQVIPLAKKEPSKEQEKPGLFSRIKSGFASLFGSKKSDADSASNEPASTSSTSESPKVQEGQKMSKETSMVMSSFTHEASFAEFLNVESEDEDVSSNGSQLNSSYFTNDAFELMSVSNDEDNSTPVQGSSTPTSKSTAPEDSDSDDESSEPEDACLAPDYDPWR